MVAEGSGWVEGLRAAGWQIEHCMDRDAYRVRGPNPEREGDFVVFEVSGMAIAAARTVQELVDHLYNMMRTAIEDSRLHMRPVHRPRILVPPNRPRRIRNIDINEVMRQQYAPAIEQMLNERVVYDEVAPEQPTLHPKLSPDDTIEAEVKAKLYLKELIGPEQLITYCDSHLIGFKAGSRGWLVGNISRPGDQVDPAWSPEVGLPRSNEIQTFCIHTVHDDWIPFTDQVIALALMAMAQPKWFLHTANSIDTYAMDHSLNPARFILQ